MSDPIGGSYAAAVNDFHNARRQGALQEIVARLWGRPNTLLAYEDVRRSLRLQGSFARGLQPEAATRSSVASRATAISHERFCRRIPRMLAVGRA